MDERKLTRAHLETFSNENLKKTATDLGLDVPDGLVRRFLIEEILESQQDGPEDAEAEAAEGEDVQIESDSFDERYHETYIGVLVRDPLWAYAYWELRDFDRQAIEAAPGFQGLKLKVTPLDATSPEEECFSIPIGPEDKAWYLSLQGTCGRFRVDLCALVGGAERVLASSRVVSVPRGVKSDALFDGDGELPPILALSGADELSVLRIEDGPSRLHIHCEG